MVAASGPWQRGLTLPLVASGRAPLRRCQLGTVARMTFGQRCLSDTATEQQEDRGHKGTSQARNERVQTTLAKFDRNLLSDPWCRMLASPLRKCVVTREIMPMDLMIQLKAVYLPPSEDESVHSEEPSSHTPTTRPSPRSGFEEAFLPDRILHPKFSPLKPGRGVWVAANRKIVANLLSLPEGLDAIEGGGLKRLKSFSTSATVPKRLLEMIAWQLEERVFQEVDLVSREFRRRKTLGKGEAVAETAPPEEPSSPSPSSSLADSLVPQELATAVDQVEFAAGATTLELHFACEQRSGSDEQPSETTSPFQQSRNSSILDMVRLIPTAERRQRLRERIQLLLAPSPPRAVAAASHVARLPRSPEFGPLAVALCRLSMFHPQATTERQTASASAQE
ncbi:unnamed protein product [Parajaminaea phylloscopi]